MTLRFLASLSAILVLGSTVPSGAVDRERVAFPGYPAGANTDEDRDGVGSERSGPFGFGRARREEARRAESVGVRQGSPEEMELRARAEAMVAKERKREAKRLARIAASRAAEGNGELAMTATSPPAAEGAGFPLERKRGGWFAGLGLGRSKGKENDPEIFVNADRIDALRPANARIEIDLSDQRARVYEKNGPLQTLVIDTGISTGKAGYETPTGTFTISEMQVEKRSTLYGTWLDANGLVVPSSGDSSPRPAGATTFVGADMPYWMRINGGIGLHIGEVPGHPASHGCIRVPAEIQPLIFSKVGPGTPVTVVP